MSEGLKKYIGGAFLIAFAGVFFFFLRNSSLQQTDHKTVLFVVGDNKAEALVKAIDYFYREYPNLANKIDIIIRTRSNANHGKDPIPASDLMLMKVSETEMFEEHLDFLKQTNARFQTNRTLKLILGEPSTKYPIEELEQFGMQADEELNKYYKNESPDELKKMLVYLFSSYLKIPSLRVQPPNPPIAKGFIVFKNRKVQKIVKTWEEWVNQQQPDPKKDKIAVLVYESAIKEGILTIENEVCQNIERKGFQPVMVFGYPSSKALKNTLIDTLLLKNKGVKAAISWFYKFPDSQAEKVLPVLDVPLVNAIDIYGNGIKEWERNKKGLSSTEVTWQMAIPEIAGMVQPTVIGGVELKDGIPYKRAIKSRVDRIVNRAIRYINLQNKQNKDKKIAFLYWNYPPGKDNIGASYLNIFESYPVLLKELTKNGYTTQNYSSALDESFKKQIKEKGRNIGKYAPGELAKLVEKGGAILVPLRVYTAWFNQLNQQYQLEITNKWGPPEKANIMTIRKNGELFFVLPAVRYGNVYFMPQADRARTQDLAALYHSQTLPPHHQYICQYLWFQHNMDAIVHTGTHGTHEWLDGKESGLSDLDSPEVLAGDLPILYIYNMDVVGEGLQAKRRGASTIVDHLTPALGEAGMTPEMVKISQLIRQWETARALNPDGTSQLLALIEQQATQLGIKKDLEKDGWGAHKKLAEQPPTGAKEMIETLQHYIEQTRSRATPFGFHTFGVSPEGNKLDNFAKIIAKPNGSERIEEFKSKLARSGGEEIRMLLHALDGKFVEAQVGNDPIRSPDAIPTGRNFYTFDPRTIPVPYADSIGKRLAETFVGAYKKSNGAYPKKVAFEVWAVETIRHQGVQEAQILALLGVKLKRNKKGQVEGVELVSRQELGRPRVDVLMSSTGLYRDNFPMFFELMNEAFQLASESPEEDNPIRKNSEKLRLELIQAGVNEQDARLRSQIRIFAEPSGTYGSKMGEAIASSGSWGDEAQLAKLYIRRMGNGYGNGYWGENLEKEFKSALSGVQSVIHSRSSSVYMSLDNDDFFAYAGAISMAVRHVDKTKKSPALNVADLHIKGNEEIKSLEKYMGQELRSRYFNPAYIKEMQKEGYAGARHIMQGVEFLWGWQVVYPEVVNDEKWQEFYEVWLKDRYNLKTESFFEEKNPHAKESISARMLEAIRKGYWKPSDAVKNDLVKMYITTINNHGVSCNHTTCNHAELTDYIRRIGLSSKSVVPKDVEAFVKKVEVAIQKPLNQAQAEQQADRKRYADDANVLPYDPNAPQKNAQKTQQLQNRQKVSGYKMLEEKVLTDNSAQGTPKQKGVQWFTPLIFGLLVLCSLLGGFLKYRN
ncbi:cobaltochelatase CobN [Runella defluvii]|uniref:Cobaltochelatase CobN n=1 Tax=Runella defluvii TaxID=370973 RepID=A0A7W6ENX3_9BACT|nr:cobaltochelatase subunit CobN [Runella defluvii]MBB3837000.1 cobaltochelatase CobN [Runella defluvii]